MKHLFTILFFFCSFAAFSQTATTTVSTTVSDPDGTVASVKIELLSGAPGVVIATPNPAPSAVKTDISFTQAGDYIFQISAVDNEGMIARKQFKITVLKADNQPPVIQIIGDQTIKLSPKQ